jgi:protein TonB
MRCFYVAFLGLAARAAQAQLPADSLTSRSDSSQYAVTLDKRRVMSATDSTGTCTEVMQWGGPGGLVRVYYPSGHLKEYVPYAELARGYRWGVATRWYDNGQLSAWQTYQDGRRHGQLLLYYESGALKRRTEYVAGNELPGNCYDADGQAIAYFPYEQLPLYPGGHTQLTKEINKTLRVPRQQLPLYYGQHCLVDVAIQVAEDGSIQAPRVVVSSRVPALDQAVLDAVAKLSKRFNPGKRDGRLVRFEYHLPVEFAVPNPPTRPGQKR